MVFVKYGTSLGNIWDIRGTFSSDKPFSPSYNSIVIKSRNDLTVRGAYLILIKDKLGKVICGADAKNKSVEILCRGIKTLIRFNRDGTYEVKTLTCPKSIT